MNNKEIKMSKSDTKKVHNSFHLSRDVGQALISDLIRALQESKDHQASWPVTLYIENNPDFKEIIFWIPKE